MLHPTSVNDEMLHFPAHNFLHLQVVAFACVICHVQSALGYLNVTKLAVGPYNSGGVKNISFAGYSGRQDNAPSSPNPYPGPIGTDSPVRYPNSVIILTNHAHSSYIHDKEQHDHFKNSHQQNQFERPYQHVNFKHFRQEPAQKIPKTTERRISSLASDATTYILATTPGPTTGLTSSSTIGDTSSFGTSALPGSTNPSTTTSATDPSSLPISSSGGTTDLTTSSGNFTTPSGQCSTVVPMPIMESFQAIPGQPINITVQYGPNFVDSQVIFCNGKCPSGLLDFSVIPAGCRVAIYETFTISTTSTIFFVQSIGGPAVASVPLRAPKGERLLASNVLHSCDCTAAPSTNSSYYTFTFNI